MTDILQVLALGFAARGYFVDHISPRPETSQTPRHFRINGFLLASKDDRIIIAHPVHGRSRDNEHLFIIPGSKAAIPPEEFNLNDPNFFEQVESYLSKAQQKIQSLKDRICTSSAPTSKE